MTPHQQQLARFLPGFEDPGALARSLDDLRAAMTRRELNFGDNLVPTFITPFFVQRDQLTRWIERSESLARQIEELAQEVLVDDALFRRLGLQPAARTLLDVDPGYRSITMLSRPDAIVDESGIVFLEFNCDSPAMMTFADALSECLLELDVYAPLREHAPSENMTGKLLQALLACWREFGGATSTPQIAITDWHGQKTRFEHRRIAAAFEAAGYPTVICDPREFSRDGKQLHVHGRRIDLVYRRALFTELLERQSEVPALLGAYRDGAICMVNSLRSYLASSKTLMAVVCEQHTSTDVAATSFLTPERIDALRRGPRNSVVKRGESHGGMHVLLPDVTSEAHWQEGLTAAAADPWPWVEQRLHDVPRLDVLTTFDGQPRVERKYFNWNPFLFGGAYAGGIARVSDTPLINISLGGGLLPTWCVS